jgi:hypothetical protein
MTLTKSKQVELLLQVDNNRPEDMIADEVGCTASLVRAVRRKLFGPRLTRSKRIRYLLTQEPELTQRQIAERLGVHASTVRYAITNTPKVDQSTESQ